MRTIEIPFGIFDSELKFHAAFAELMGFPGFYGQNWNAWIDCMSSINDRSAELSRVTVDDGEQLELSVSGYAYSADLDQSKVFRDFAICTGFVNTRFKRRESGTRIIISN
jgi:RNAse (barnase) inhibitor barstar